MSSRQPYLTALWHGDRQRTELLLVEDGNVTLIDRDVDQRIAEELAARFGMLLEIRPGAFRPARPT
jgi:hypothetical protein